MTAKVTCTKKAAEAPSQTKTGFERLPMISVAIMVLSGISEIKITAKTVTMMPSCTVEFLRVQSCLERMER